MKASQALLALIANPPAVEFMSSAFTAALASGGALTKPADIVAGDIVLLWVLDCPSGLGVATSGGLSWNKHAVALGAGATNGWAMALWKQLNATDVANGWIADATIDDCAVAVRYRSHGATGLTVKDTTTNGSGTTTLTLDGYTKAAGHYGTVAMLAAPNSAGAGGIVVPSGFAERRRDSGAGLTATFVSVIADLVSGYQDGAAVTFTNCDAEASESGILLEFTGP